MSVTQFEIYIFILSICESVGKHLDHHGQDTVLLLTLRAVSFLCSRYCSRDTVSMKLQLTVFVSR